MKKFKTLIVYTVIVSILLTITALVAAVQIPEVEAYNFDYAVSDPGNIRPTLHSGNSPDSMPGLMYFKKDDGPGFDTSEEGSYVFNLVPDGSKQIKIWLAEDEGDKVFIDKWEAVGVEVMYFLVKGSDFYFQYAYDGSLMTDGHLYTPRTYNEPKKEYKNISQISHFTIFFRDPTEESEESTIVESSSEETSIVESSSEETTIVETSSEETSIVESSSEETTILESSSEETTILESSSEATTASETTILVTTAPSDATITNATTTEINLTTESIPLASVTTTQSVATTTVINLTTESIPLASVTSTQPTNASVVTSTIPLTTLTNPDIPLTGENGSNSGLAIGLILLLMAASLTVVVFRSKAAKEIEK